MRVLGEQQRRETGILDGDCQLGDADRVIAREVKDAEVRVQISSAMPGCGSTRSIICISPPSTSTF